MKDAMQDLPAETDIAIVGMAAHLPGAADIAAYWENLRQGRSAVRRLTEEEILASGESPAVLRNPNYVPAAALLEGYDRFDAEFFGFSPKEAAILDPQHRQFLEVAWEALESAGHTPEGFKGRIGVFAGCGMGSYFYFNLCSNPALVESTGMFLLRHTGNDKDFLSTRVSHVFDLKGPSLGIQTACSTSLVAVHYAIQALLNGECDMALAGGVTIDLPQGRGYLYKEGEVLSPDGVCHAFDHRAQGTVFGSGAGTVLLRRLEDALADGDHIWGVIKGSAVNNDGAAKAGYLAPSVEGQSACVATALAVAGTPAETIDYVECHGTGTYLGDPIEVAALTEAFRRTTNATGFARIGSVKTNIGHLDTAAGVASLIKTTLALYHGQMPPSLNFEAPNPAIDFDNSPFRVNDRLSDWPRRMGPRRAGVNSLGVGGTNAFVVVQEPPAVAASEPSDWPFQLITLSARSQSALGEASQRLAAHLRAHPEQDLADVAWTLKEGRRAFEHRRVLVAGSHEEAAKMLEAGDPRRVFTQRRLGDAPDVVFMFPGGGAQYPNMARDLYETEPVFAEWMDRGLAALGDAEAETRALWLPAPGQEQAAAEALRQPSKQLPLILIVEVALAQLWESWGVRPAVLIGHSMGENAAACVAGVMTLEAAVGLVRKRGELFDTVPAGGMLSVPLSEAALKPYLGDLDIASVNAPELTVVSGSDAGLKDLAERLKADGIDTTRIAIDIAAHSRMLEGILPAFRAHLAGMQLSPPQIPIISNRTGQVLTDAEATSPDYWVAHLRNTVRFADGMATLRQKADRVYLEVGPGRAMASLAQANGAMGGQPVPASLRHPDDTVSDDRHFIATLGRLWACGAEPDLTQLWGEAKRRRVPLPTYPFQRSRYFVERGTPAVVTEADLTPARHDSVTDFGYRIGWRVMPADCPVDVETELGDPLTWLVFADEAGLARAAVQRLRSGGHRVITVHAGDAFARTSDDTYTLAPEHGREGYDALLADLAQRDLSPARIAHFWLVTEKEAFRPGSSFFQRNLEQGFWSLFFLGQAMGEIGLKPLPHLTVVTSGAAQVRTEALPYPEKATVAGPVRVMPRELPGLTASLLDVTLDRKIAPETVSAVIEEMLATPANTVAAIRGSRRLETRLVPAKLPDQAEVPEGSVWVITGGFGGIGVTVAERLMRDRHAKVALIGRHVPEPGSVRAGVLSRLERLGRVMAVAADVCNPEEMRAAFDRVRAEFGPIHGVVHAAGTVDDAPLLGKDPGSADAVLSPKVHGTKLLDTLLPDGSVDRIVLFSSTSTVLTPAGQADYVAANEYLNAFAKSRAGGLTKVTSVNWGIWSGIGMAADADARRQGKDAGTPLPGQLVLERMQKGEDETRFHATLTKDQWVMDDHRLLDGTAVLPGSAYPEIASEALMAAGLKGGLHLTDLTVFRPLRLEADLPRDLRVSLTRARDGSQRLQARALEPQGWALTAEMGVAPLTTQPETLDLAAIAARCPDKATAPGGETLPSAQEDRIAFGPRWQVLKATALGNREGLATLALPTQAVQDTATCTIHPALYDIGTGWGIALLPKVQEGFVWAPVMTTAIRVHGPLPAEIRSWVRLSGTPAEDTASFDVTLTDPSGKVLVEVEGITFRKVAFEEALAKPQPPNPRDVIRDEDQRGQSPAEQRLAQALAGGIRPAEGAEAFLRALAADGAQVLVSSLDLEALVKQANAPVAAETEGPGFARPELESAYVAPRNSVERTLAGFWAELLGVAEVGVEDDFFALGGHSLIAVRLFAMIRRQWKVDFPISVLFEAPTIARCAQLIIDRIGPQDDSAPAPTALADPAGPKFTHLVAMHRGEGGPKTSFFLVAGMFGNVLNLRHLASLLGTDRPFYGLQAKGLFGDDKPHMTIEEAAASCLAEIRQVQPKGPYLLGGFSGGGLTAWDIGRQLRAEGEEVALMVLLDTPLPVRPFLTKPDKALIKLAELRAGGPKFLAEWARRRWEWERSRRAKAANEPDPTVPSYNNAAIEAAFRHAIGVYQLKRWEDGNVVLYRPPLDRHYKVTGGNWVSKAREYVFHDNLWTPFAPRLEVVEVPGDHDSMVLEPNVRVLAARMKAAIQAAEAGEAARPPKDLQPNDPETDMTLTALLIGNESLTVECGKRWLERGHRLAAVVTREPRVAAWAAGAGLRVIAPGAGLVERTAGLEVDWLLSVANLSLVPAPILALARKGGVNFHDGPLPGYAGLNAPVWAILNSETAHAVTWHLMTEGIDEGEVLATRSFAIEPDDTAFTLNARCFSAALDSFTDVIAALEAGGQPRQPQAPGPRKVWMRSDRPSAAGRLDFAQPAEAVARRVRALDHGGYRNPLAVPKVEAAGQVWAVGLAEVVAGSGVPGAVLARDADSVTVACGSGAVRLSRLTCLKGLPIDTARAGALLPSPDAAETARLDAALAPAAEAEARLRGLLLHPDPALASADSAAQDWRQIPLDGPEAKPARLALAALCALGRSGGDLALGLGADRAPGYLLPWVPVRLDATGPLAEAEARASRALDAARAAGGVAADLALREPGLTALSPSGLALGEGTAPLAGSTVTITTGPTPTLWHDAARLPAAEAARLAERIARVLARMAATPEADLSGISPLSEAETRVYAGALAATRRDYDRQATLPGAILAQAMRTPEATAVVAGEARLTYAQLADRAGRIANTLRGLGVGRGTLVGLACRRTTDMVAGALGIQLAGAAYVPMDPTYPADRLALYAEDSGCPVILTESAVAEALPHGPARLVLDTDPRLAATSAAPPADGPTAEDPAYVIYTSGSTGRPKGVVVTHRNAMNFFAGMDDVLGTDPGTWLAVTSLSFDISVLELFWTLTRGFTVVLADDSARVRPSAGSGGGNGISPRKMEFSVYYWGNDDLPGPSKYELLLEGAKFADQNGFVAIWTPERHFHAFGGPYPNPSVTGAAAAAVTKNIGVRAGSIVAPLHHPARIAEEWAVIDNLTNGRAGLAFASGWQPDDFVLRPENTPPANRQALFDSLDAVRKLWRGEAVDFPRKDGTPFAVRTQPRPVSREVEAWVTTAGNPETWRDAGKAGAHVLTHLLGQSIAEVADKVKLYRAALAEAGHDPSRFKVTLMLHTFLASDRETAREVAREPMKSYLRSAAGLIKQYAWAFPAFKKPQGVANPMDIDLRSLAPDEMEAILDFAFQRYFEDSGLFGTVEDAVKRVEELKAIDIDEVACLIDYGIATPVVLEGLKHVAEVLRITNSGAEADYSMAGLIHRHGVTHLQCTPSMARMLAEDPGARAALSRLKRMLVGGEALMGRLAGDLSGLIGGPVLNMYGPTETTIWSSVEATTGAEGVVNIGQPIANTALYVLDDSQSPVADGEAGELWIGGEGVAQGYFRRPDLTADRFRPDPFAGQGRMYRTGDLVRRRPDGKLDYLGRADFQVKIRGHRIELGEIETALEAMAGIRQAVVIAREDQPGDVRLVAYVTADGPVDEQALRRDLSAHLPEVMVPAHVVRLEAMPLTPNGKVDRKALPSPHAAAAPAATKAVVPLEGGVEATIAAVFARVLGVPQVGRSDNFFTLGGHSLLAVQAHRELKVALNSDRIAITDIFRFPVVSALAEHVAKVLPQASAIPAQVAAPAPQPGATGAADSRMDAMARRRAMREAREKALG